MGRLIFTNPESQNSRLITLFFLQNNELIKRTEKKAGVECESNECELKQLSK